MMRLLIRCLLRCYPRAWRRRYGDEFAALLEQARPTPARVLDALRSALDAHRRQWGRWAMQVLSTRMLDRREQDFWRRWVLVFLLTGVCLGLIYAAVPLLGAARALQMPQQRATGEQLAALPLGLSVGQWWGIVNNWRVWVTMPLLGLLGLGLGLAQWRALRSFLPGVQRRWIAATFAGPCVAALVMTVDRDFNRLPDLLSMTSFVLSSIGRVSAPTPGGGDLYRLLLVAPLPVVFFGGLAAAFQAYALKGLVPRAGWWIGVSILAAIAALAVARLGALFRTTDYRPGPEIIRPDRFLLDIAITAGQVAAACAIYGLVSGLGLIALRRGDHSDARPHTVALAR